MGEEERGGEEGGRGFEVGYLPYLLRYEVWTCSHSSLENVYPNPNSKDGEMFLISERFVIT